MKSISNHQLQLKLSQQDIRKFSDKRVEYRLGFFNRLMNTCVYMIDYRTRKLIFADVPCPTISGFSRDILKQEGFNIYAKILPPDELQWLQKMQEESQRIYFNYSIEERIGLDFYYDLMMTGKGGQSVPIYQRIVPYRLCNAGNIWLALSVISAVPFTYKTTKACIDNHVTGERYDFIDDKFVLSKRKHLTQDEVTILRYLASGFSLKDAATEIGTKYRTALQKETSAFRKLGVTTQAAAVYRANTQGLL